MRESTLVALVNMSMVDFHLDSNALAVLFELSFFVAPVPRNEHFLDGSEYGNATSQIYRSVVLNVIC